MAFQVESRIWQLQAARQPVSTLQATWFQSPIIHHVSRDEYWAKYYPGWAVLTLYIAKRLWNEISMTFFATDLDKKDFILNNLNLFAFILFDNFPPT